MHIIVLKKKVFFAVVIALLVCLIGLAFGLAFSHRKTVGAFGRKTIVLDPGHGGIDNGVVGAAGTIESEKNLQISLMLKEVLEDAGFNVVLTRKDKGGLYETEKDFKKQDFAKRKEITLNASPDALISVHCNKFPTKDRRGAQVFFNATSKSGRNLAGAIQNGLNGLNVAHTGRAYSALPGDYFMLNLTEAPSVIVECGFLSNADDEKLLCDEKYLREFVDTLAFSIIEFLE